MEDAGGKKKSSGKKRGAGFHPQDDLQLAKSWIAVSEDPIKGTDQTKDSFWSSVKEHGGFETRTPDGLRQRWGVVSRAVSKFCGIMTNLQNKNQSGTTDEDKLDKAAVIFKQDEGKEFRFLACYDVLSFCPKFSVDLGNSVGAASTSAASTSTASPSAANSYAESPTGRPCGRDKSKFLSNNASNIHALELRRAEALERIASAAEVKAKVFTEYKNELRQKNVIQIATTRLDDLDPISRKIMIIEKQRVLQELTVSNNSLNTDSSNISSRIDGTQSLCAMLTPKDDPESVNHATVPDDDIFQKFIEIDNELSEEENFSEN
ncbi:uncharacterized protein LOC120420922 [Culex pipiens pallens]|uniref:uncharacterized protein LOC120420922 n=1 Tax=Culex pipiens pallens TaxID=42434 RepID=UPI001954595C|nr:uncharacterized protein LOC120420922 [Culex pipiens pallens]